MRSLNQSARLRAARQRRVQANELSTVGRTTRRKAGSKLWVPLLVLVLACVCAAWLLFSQARLQFSRQIGVLVVAGTAEGYQHPLGILLLLPEEKGAKLIPLPDDLLVETIDGYGAYRAAALEGLRKLEKKQADFLLQTLNLQFGTHLTEVLWMGTPDSRVTRDAAVEALRAAATLSSKSTLGVVDRIKLLLYTSKIPRSAWDDIDLQASGVLLPMKTGEVGVNLDLVAYDELASRVLSDDSLRKEELTVAVINSSQQGRVGAKVGRMYANLGMDVISVTTSTAPSKQTRVYVAKDAVEKTYTSEVIRSLFSLSPAQQSVDAEKTLEYRADIVVVIGEDWGVRLKGTK